MKTTNNRGGFTLIELLIVISIISLLASIVLSSMADARNSATAAAIKTEAVVLFNLAQAQFFKTGDYGNFSSRGFVTSAADCETRIQVTAENEAIAESICKSIMSKLPTIPTNGNYRLHLGCQSSAYCDINETYSVQVKLQDSSLYNDTDWFCIGSSGGNYLGAFSNTGNGCRRNP